MTTANATVSGTLTVPGRLYIKGGTSEHNPSGAQTHFSWQGDNRNYIRGDTEITGNLKNAGDLAVGRNLSVAGTASIPKLGERSCSVSANGSCGPNQYLKAVTFDATGKFTGGQCCGF